MLHVSSDPHLNLHRESFKALFSKRDLHALLGTADHACLMRLYQAVAAAPRSWLQRQQALVLLLLRLPPAAACRHQLRERPQRVQRIKSWQLMMAGS